MTVVLCSLSTTWAGVVLVWTTQAFPRDAEMGFGILITLRILPPSAADLSHKFFLGGREGRKIDSKALSWLIPFFLYSL